MPNNRRTCSLVLIALGIAISSSLWAQTPAQRPGGYENPNSRYIVFVHTGGGPSNTPALLENILTNLLKNGFSVRRPDEQQDKVGGPGVDYFSEEDEAKAKEVADIVNAVLPADARRLTERRQKVRNPPGYLGVWLF